MPLIRYLLAPTTPRLRWRVQRSYLRRTVEFSVTPAPFYLEFAAFGRRLILWTGHAKDCPCDGCPPF